MATDNEVTWKPDFTKPDPYADMPPEYEEKVKATFVPTAEHPTSPIEEARARGEAVGTKPPPPPVEPVPEAPPPPMPEVAPPPEPTGWKPDFTKDDPWEGMPQEYVELEVVAYKPTEEQPLPPSQRTPEGTAAREKAPEVSEKIAGIKLAPKSTPDKPILSQADYEAYQKLQDKQKFLKQVELGLIEKGSVFIPGLKVEYAPGVPEEERILEPREWAYATPEEVARVEAEEAEVIATKEEIDTALAKLSGYKEDSGYNLQKAFGEGKGADVYEAKALGLFTDEDIIATQFGAIESTQLPDGQWIDKGKLAEYEETSPEMYKALITSGFEAADKVVTDQQEAFATLGGYGVLQAPIGTGIPFEVLKEQFPIGYDIARYLKDHPENSAVLVTAGFDPKEVTGAKLASETYGLPVYDISIEEKIKYLEPLQFRDETTGKTVDIHSLIEKEGKGVVDTVWNEINPEWKANLVTAQAQHTAKRDWEIGIIPVAGTVYLWDKMPTWAKSVSIVGDVVFFACLTGVNPAKWVAPRIFQRAPKATAIYQRVVAQNVDDAVKVLGGIDPKLLKPFQGAVNAATKYADDFTRVKALQYTIAQCDDILKSGRLTVGSIQHQATLDLLAQSTDDLARATSRTAASRTTLLKLTGEYTDDATRRLLPTGALSSEERTLLESLKGIPDRLVKSIENVAIPPTVDVATLQAQLLTKKSALLAAKTKFPLDPTKWMDLVDDVSRLEGKLLNARVGNVQVLYNQLLAARQTLPELEKALGTLSKGTIQYDEMAREITRVKGLIETLPKQVDDAIKAMRIEAVQGGYWGGSVAVMSPVDTAKLAGLTAGVTSVELTKTGLLPLTTAIAAKTVVPITLEPRKAPIITPFTPTTAPVPVVIPTIAPVTPTIIAPAVVTPIAPELIPVTPIKPIIKPVIEPIIKPPIEPALEAAIKVATEAMTDALVKGATTVEAEAAAKVAIKPMALTAIQTATALATAVETTTVTPVEIIEPPIIPWLEGLSEAEKKRILAEEGKVFWKERDRWLIIESPWTQNDVRISTTPPPEARVTEGTPQETLQFVGKIPWKTMSIDYGDLDIVITVEGERIVEVIKTTGAINIDTTGKGSLTDIGKRLPSTMKGISIPSATGREAIIEEPKEVPKEEEKVPFLTWVESPGWMFGEDKPKVRKPSEPRYKTLAEKMAQGGRVVEPGLRPRQRKKKPLPKAPGDRYYLGHKLPDSNLRVEL